MRCDISIGWEYRRKLLARLDPRLADITGEEVTGLQYAMTDNPVFAHYANAFTGSRAAWLDVVRDPKIRLTHRTNQRKPMVEDRDIWLGDITAREIGRMLESIERCAAPRSLDYDGAMSLAESLLPEFDREMGITRRLLDRIPDGQFAWKPHEKSMTLGRLAEHLAELPMWAKVAIERSGIDMGDGRPEGYVPPATRAAVLQTFDGNVSAARAALSARSDAELMAPWTLKAQGKELFTMPKATVLRGFVMNHIIHHRGQMSVYLRLQNIPVPSMYGPSADEAI